MARTMAARPGSGLFPGRRGEILGWADGFVRASAWSAGKGRAEGTGLSGQDLDGFLLGAEGWNG